ncbi:MAG: hypothetical protein LUO93_04275, partial [Methanomicrobiales archaeon]|nr:hypothetical protein [Methanomicrobiales archaeon]
RADGKIEVLEERISKLKRAITATEKKEAKTPEKPKASDAPAPKETAKAAAPPRKINFEKIVKVEKIKA